MTILRDGILLDEALKLVCEAEAPDYSVNRLRFLARKFVFGNALLASGTGTVNGLVVVPNAERFGRLMQSAFEEHTTSLWKTGYRRPSRAVQLLHRLCAGLASYRKYAG